MVSAEIISDNIRVAKEHGNAITVIPCAEAMLQTEDGEVSSGTYPRDSLKRTQTPQAFKLGEICQLHRDALESGITNSIASCTLMIEMGKQVYFSQGSEKNIKLTTLEDIDIFKALLAASRSDWLKD
jgi:2-C-methyl-D-erythritol 4-phosphate cytidylyltransferase